MHIETKDGRFIGDTPLDWLRAFQRADKAERIRLAAAVPRTPSGGWRGHLARALETATADGHGLAAKALRARVAALPPVAAWNPTASYGCPACKRTLPALDIGYRMTRIATVSLDAASDVIQRARATVSARDVHKVAILGAGKIKGAVGEPDVPAVRILLPALHSWCVTCRSANGRGEAVDPTAKRTPRARKVAG